MMEERNNPLPRIQVVALMLHFIRNEVEARVEEHLAKHRGPTLPRKRREALEFALAVSTMLRNAQAVLCECLDDPALRALSPYAMDQSDAAAAGGESVTQPRQGRRPPSDRRRCLRPVATEDS